MKLDEIHDLWSKDAEINTAVIDKKQSRFQNCTINTTQSSHKRDCFYVS